MAIKVKLREKKISGDRVSLFLDFYPAIVNPKTGDPTRREFLGIYLSKKSKSVLDKQHDKDQLQIAEHIRQIRENELNKPEIYTGFEKEQLRIKEQGDLSFIDYFKGLVDKKKTSNYDNWVSAYNYLVQYTGGKLIVAEVTERFCNEFKEYLLTTKSIKSSKVKLKRNSAVSYFNKLKAALKQAYKDGLLGVNLNEKIECIETDEVLKQTLTIEELNLLAESECKYPSLKNIVLFAALTGIPFKEMQNLCWGQIEQSETFGIRIKMIRQKTGKPYLVNISKQAFDLLDERSENSVRVFNVLNDSLRYYFFPLWLSDVGINKKMTFHDLRHTYGCLQIDAGTDIYTLQGNMAHSTPRQSMKYGKISDQRKRVAAEVIQLNRITNS